LRISFKAGGGFAAIPGLSKPIHVDTSTLPAEQRAEIEQLIAAAHFFDQPASLGAPARGAADMRTYTMTIEDAGRSHTIQRTDPVEDSALAEIIDWFLALRRRGSP
jgi:hypothetical protein